MSAPSSDRAAIRQTIRALKAANHKILSVNIGEGVMDLTGLSEKDMLDEITAGDEATIEVQIPDGPLSFIFFVLGNDPEEVICDHGVNLSPVLDPLTQGWWS